MRVLPISLGLVLALVSAAGPALADDLDTNPPLKTADGAPGLPGKPSAPGADGAPGRPGAPAGASTSGSISVRIGSSNKTSSDRPRGNFAPNTSSAGPAENSVSSDLAPASTLQPTVSVQPGPEPASQAARPAADQPRSAPQRSNLDKAAAVGGYLLAMLGLALAAIVLIPMEFINRLARVKPIDRAGPKHSIRD